MKGYMDKMDQALDEMNRLIQSANDDDATVDDLKVRLQAWHERWIEGDELPGIMKAGLLTAFLAVFNIASDSSRKPGQSLMHRTPDQIAREGGSRPEGRS